MFAMRLRAKPVSYTSGGVARVALPIRSGCDGVRNRGELAIATQSIAPPQMQMGPTRRSTPLSPARGPFPKKRYLAPSVVAVWPRSEDRFLRALSPVLAPASGSVGRLVRIRRSFPSTRRFRDRTSWWPFTAGPASSGRSLSMPTFGKAPGETGRWLHCFAFLSGCPASNRSSRQGALQRPRGQ